MKHLILNQSIVFFVGIALLVGCFPSATRYLDEAGTVTPDIIVNPSQTVRPAGTETPQAQATMPPTPVPDIQVTEPIKKEKFQITYMNSNDGDTAKIYGRDITCIEEDRLCLADPVLLFEAPLSSGKTKDQPNSSIFDYGWSPFGDKLVLSGSANRDIFIIDIDTQEWENITRSSDVDDYSPQWSYDGNFIYYASCPVMDGMGLTCQLMRYDINEKVMSPWLTGIGYTINTFSINSELQIVFSSPNKGSGDLFQSDLFGLDVKPLTTTEKDLELYPSFSPDGNYVVFFREGESDDSASIEWETDVILLELESGKEVNLTDNFSDGAYTPKVSFDGKQIVFTSSDKDFNSNVFVLFLGTKEIQQITFDGKNSFSVWRRYIEK